jgi:predicted nucleic acid-binding protein
MIVSDASLVVDFLIDEGERGAWAAAEIASARRICAPHLLDVEVLAALRKRVSARELSSSRGLTAVRDLADLPISRYPSVHLLERIWQLRGRLTAYDAAYVALAEALAVRLARVGGHDAEVRAFGG